MLVSRCHKEYLEVINDYYVCTFCGKVTDAICSFSLGMEADDDLSYSNTTDINE